MKLKNKVKIDLAQGWFLLATMVNVVMLTTSLTSGPIESYRFIVNYIVNIAVNIIIFAIYTYGKDKPKEDKKLILMLLIVLVVLYLLFLLFESYTLFNM